jgi:hypothetical protein
MHCLKLVQVCWAQVKLNHGARRRWNDWATNKFPVAINIDRGISAHITDGAAQERMAVGLDTD